MGPLVKDRDWIRQSFLIDTSGKDNGLEKVDRQNRIFSSVAMKYTDTSPGGNFAINPPPQFTSSADLKPVLANGRPSRALNSNGMGRYYSESIDDQSQIVTMRFGVPQYNSLTTFFSSFYNTQAGTLARTGRASSFFFTIGKAAGFVVSIFSVRLLAVSLIGNGLKLFMGKKPTRFYYMKPTMQLYWNAAQTILNHIAVNKGIVPRLLGKDSNYDPGDKYEFSEDAKKKLRDSFPDGIFTTDGSINMYAISTKAQRLAQQHQKKMNEMADQDNVNLAKSLQEVYTQQLAPGKADYAEYLKKWTDSAQMRPTSTPSDPAALNAALQPATGELPPAGTPPEEGGVAQEEPSNGSTEMIEPTAANYAGVDEAIKASLNDGADFIAFRVNATGPVTESFSSQVVDSEIMSKINGISSAARAKNFNFANGNLVGGALGSMIGSVTEAVKDFMGGVAAGVGMSGIATMNGGAFVDIPKHWQSSIASMPHTTYTFDLVSPYGNPISQLFNLYMPLALILAAALPLSTGTQSYTSPFLCELYDRGRCQIRLGMIDSLSITRGTGNTGWNNDGNALAIQVSFSVVDMSSVMHMPISEGFTNGASNFGINVAGSVGVVAGGVGGAAIAAATGEGVLEGAKSGVQSGLKVGGAVGAAAGAPVDVVRNAVRSVDQIFSEDTIFSDYMAVLASMGVADQIYNYRKFKNNLTKNMTNWDTWYSKAHYASMLGDSGIGRAASAIFKGTER